MTLGADFISAGVKLATYILCSCLILSSKKAGRVTSNVQFLFWFLLVTCQGQICAYRKQGCSRLGSFNNHVDKKREGGSRMSTLLHKSY